MRKVKVRTLYLIAIIVGGLVGLATKSTYAMFTASAEIDNPICMSANLTSEEETIETMEVVMPAGEKKIVPVTINNTSTNTVGYSVWYTSPSDEVEIGIKLSNSDSSNSTGTISSNGSKKVYVQIINNSSSSVTITLGVISNKTSNDMTLIPNTELIFRNTAVETITKLYTNAVKTTVINNSITYNYATSVGLMNDRKGSMSTGIDAGNIRYYGANPNNYIYFNCSDYSNQSSSTCELWRIIGVFDGKVKIMRNESIGAYSWDNKVKDSTWGTAKLMKLLNPGYESETVGGSLYYNSGSGNCYSGKNNVTTTCNFTSNGLKDNFTKNVIAEQDWNIGPTLQNYVNAEYENEVKNTFKTYIGLPNVSDYGYATNLSLCNALLVNYGNSECKNNNWMFYMATGSKKMSYFINYASNVDADISGYLLINALTEGGNVDVFDNDISEATPPTLSDIFPTLYLSNLAAINDGTGTSSDPYQLSV